MTGHVRATPNGSSELLGTIGNARNGTHRSLVYLLQQQASAPAREEEDCKMAKSLRSKIKRRFRTELRKRIGVPHQQEMEAKIQDNLKKALEAQGKRATRMLVWTFCRGPLMCVDDVVQAAASRCLSSRS